MTRDWGRVNPTGCTSRSTWYACSRIQRCCELSGLEGRHGQLSLDGVSFAANGYLRLEGAFSADLARRWTEGAEARAAADPARTLIGYDAQVAPWSSLDLARPNTWPLDTVSFHGDGSWSVAERMPRLWDAMCALLGGSDRIETATMTDYTVYRPPRCEEPGPDWRRWLWRRRARPTPHPQLRPGGWHIDDPAQGTRLQGLPNGLVTVLLLTDVAPFGGPTALAVGSAAALTRMFERDSALDLADSAVVAEALERSSGVHSAVGRAGDVYLLHPLTLHTASVNYGHRQRYIANPNIRLKGGLDLTRESMSLVERVTLDWARESL